MRPIRSILSFWLLAVGLASHIRAADPALATFENDVKPVLRAFCFQCHGGENAKGGIRFDQLDPDLVNGSDPATWHDVLDQLNLGQMPPQEAKQPSVHQRQLLTDWILSALRTAAEAKQYQNGRVVTRRLTRYEYANTMRDLLGINLDFARDLPPEPASPEGFLNSGGTLEMSPTQIEVYLEVARWALAEAIITGDQPQLHAFAQTDTAVGNLPDHKLEGHGPVQPEFILDLSEFPEHGEFELKITARAAIPEGRALPRIHVSMGHVPGIRHVPRGDIGQVDVFQETETFTFRGRMEDFPLPGPTGSWGDHGFKGMIVMIDFLDAEGNELRYADRHYSRPAIQPKKGEQAEKNGAADQLQAVPFGSRLDIEVTSVEFKAPVYASWPPPSHQRLLFSSESSADGPRYVRQLLQRFMTSAFRRPVKAEEVEQTALLFEAIRPQMDSFEAAIRETFAAVLVSPHFLYIVEHRDANTGEQRITDYELASRLSYFLWSSSPDVRLLTAAERCKLHQPDVLREEVTRMLADARSSEFTQRFVSQWLNLDALDRVAVNPEFFPEFDDALKIDMGRETQAYFTEVLYNDHSALELLDSNWAMLNRRLAKHYGLNGPRSSRFERVDLGAESRRGGLLGQGAFLLSNANGVDSHPIKRAVWILDRLLDSPPAPPPADVPELDPESPDLANLTLKEQLAVHRQKESCANCHRGIDPWGLPLENFDAVGKWRSEIPAQKNRLSQPVDAMCTLPNGTEIDGVRELQRYLVEHRSRLFARSLVKRLMAYGLGRSLDLGDREAVEALTTRFVDKDFRLKSLIVEFVQSETFRTK